MNIEELMEKMEREKPSLGTVDTFVQNPKTQWDFISLHGVESQVLVPIEQNLDEIAKKDPDWIKNCLEHVLGESGGILRYVNGSLLDIQQRLDESVLPVNKAYLPTLIRSLRKESIPEAVPDAYRIQLEAVMPQCQACEDIVQRVAALRTHLEAML